jgi:SAM-dependent methyltransferase
LEHIPEPKKFMEEVVRVLRPGGVLLLTTSQTWGLHLEPHDFYRYTEYGLRYLAKESGLAVVDLVPTSGLWATLTQRVADTVVNTYCAGRSRWVIVVLSLLLAPVLVMGYGLDRLCGKRGDTLDHVMVAKKTADS